MIKFKEDRTVSAIATNILLAAISLFFNGFGVYLTIQANIGAGPWDVLNLGVAKTFGILYGTASVAISYFREEPAVLAIYDLPVGTDLEFDSERMVFIDSNIGKEYR